MLRHTVGREPAEVRASIAGLAESRIIYRPPFGCVNATGTTFTTAEATPATGVAAPALLTPALIAPIAGADPVQTADPALRAALDYAFEEPAQTPRRWTQAVVVVHKDRVIAERYAPGIGIDTPLAGWSATKSVTNALLGILVRQGKLDMNAPAPIAAWADPQDPRHAITPDQLLRMTSGLDIGQSLNAVTSMRSPG